LLARDPSQDAGLDRAKIGPEQPVSGRRNNHRAGAIADDGERLGIKLFHGL
jgi:hypothetical protein